MEQRSEENFLNKDIIKCVYDIRDAINKKNYSLDAIEKSIKILKNSTRDEDEFKKYLNILIGVPKETLLFLAARWGKKDVVEYLLNKGADPHVMSTHRNLRTGKEEMLKPLHACIHFGYMDILDVFRHHARFGNLKDYEINEGKGTLGQYVLSAKEGIWDEVYTRFGASLFEEKNNYKENSMAQGIFEAVLYPEKNYQKLRYLFKKNITITDNINNSIKNICVAHKRDDLILKLEKLFFDEKLRRSRELSVYSANAPSLATNRALDDLLKEARERSMQKTNLSSTSNQEIISATQKETENSMQTENEQTTNITPPQNKTATPMQVENAPTAIINPEAPASQERSTVKLADTSSETDDSSEDDDIPLSKKHVKKTRQLVVNKPSDDKNKPKEFNSNIVSKNKITKDRVKKPSQNKSTLSQKRKNPDEIRNDKGKVTKKSKSSGAPKENQKIGRFSKSTIERCAKILKGHEKLLEEIGLIDVCSKVYNSWTRPIEEASDKLLAKRYQSNTEPKTVVKGLFTRLLVFRHTDGASVYKLIAEIMENDTTNILLVDDEKSKEKDFAEYGRIVSDKNSKKNDADKNEENEFRKKAKTINSKVHKKGDVLVRRVTVDGLVEKVALTWEWMQKNNDSNNNLAISVPTNQQIETLEFEFSLEQKFKKQTLKPAQAVQEEPEPPAPFVYQPENTEPVQETAQKLYQEIPREAVSVVISENPALGSFEANPRTAEEDKNDINIEDLRAERDRLRQLLVEARERNTHATQERNELKLTLHKLTRQYGSLKTTLKNNLQEAKNSLDKKTVQRQELEKKNLTLRSPDKYGQSDKYGRGSPGFYRSAATLPTDASLRIPIRGASLPDTLLSSNKSDIPGSAPPDNAPEDSASPK